jgi:hypothetical protein
MIREAGAVLSGGSIPHHHDESAEIEASRFALEG